ncbi:MAG: phosphoglucosamine mutase [Candidatus Omnitrophica bacterium]|nr:phosphoglucosamine mutase [Candidatus Omnitrophota bacterium]
MELVENKREKLFGTDGIRGEPGVYPLTDGMVFKIGKSLARLISYKKENNKRAQVIIGKDTRFSSGRLEKILSDALNSYDIDVYLAGIITTPALSFLVRELKADMGLMISASHNRPEDNGLKFFNQEGLKMSAEEEEWIEDIVFRSLIHVSNGVDKKKTGRVLSLSDAQPRYLRFLKSTLQQVSLKGFRVVLDCACGSGSVFGKKIFKKLGAKIVCINDSLSGESINCSGAVNPLQLQQKVLEEGADIGIGLDGDADRVVLVDEQGRILDGDDILAILAWYLSKEKKLAGNTVISTIMSNLGLRISLENNGIRLISTKVGTNYVLKGLFMHNLNLGGEQSGQIILMDYLPSPDGFLTALQVLKVMKKEGLSLSNLGLCITKFPQIVVNVEVKDKKPFEAIPSIQEAISKWKSILENRGRLLVRYSGTESLARIMVEADDKSLITEIAEKLSSLIRREVGSSAVA